MATRVRSNHVEVADRLRRTREALGLSQVDLCRRADFTTQAWNNWETGRKRISVDHAIKLRAATGIPLDWVYCGDMSAVPLEIAVKLQKVPEAPQKQRKRA